MPPKAARGRSANRTVNNFPRPRSPSPETFEESSASSSSSDNDSSPPVLISPIKRRNINQSQVSAINKKSDLEVWDLPDLDIINAAKAAWRSEAYDHFDISLQRDTGPGDTPVSLTFIFTCKSRPADHRILLRPRSKTGEGTSNLVKTVKACLSEQGISTSNARPLTDNIGLTYSAAAHRALLALRCAKSLRPFNSIADEEYHLEVSMLRPDTILPSPMTVSRDINRIYLEMSRYVKEYFKKLNGMVHLVLDGWTSPLVSSYLGLVVIWYENGQIHRAILEFIRLTQKHDGRYLAKVVGACMKRFGLENSLFSICMDNATNCDKLAELLPIHLPAFRGAKGRLRCLAHIFNLIAKIFISFFFKHPKSKKSIRIAAGARTRGFRRPGESSIPDMEEEVVLDEGDGTDTDSPNEDNIAIEEEANASLETADDEGQGLHNERVAKTLRERAIQIMEDRDIYIDADEERIVLQIFPRISGLARRVHDSSTLRERFDKMVLDDPNIAGTRQALARRVPTRWNSDLDCLQSHFFFHDVVEQLTAVPSLGLKAYQLSKVQWKIADDVHEILLLFDDVTKIFSTAETPLVVDVIPTLEDLREGMIAARDDERPDISNIVRVACQASLLLIDKYSTFADNCDIYLVAIAMCPDRKLKWFKDHGRTKHDITAIDKIVTAIWKDKYAPKEPEESRTSSTSNNRTTRRSRYAPIVPEARLPADHITTYLKEPLLPTSTIQEAGGYMMYWHQAMSLRPSLARMASDFCSAPATSVDAERAFSTGRRQVNFMQHHMSSQTFKAQMAVGSWAKSNSPLNPGFNFIKNIIDKEIDTEENVFLDSESPLY